MPDAGNRPGTGGGENRGSARVLVATPQRDELDPVLQAWQKLGHPSTRRRVGDLWCHAVPSLDIVAAVAGHGKAQFAVQAQYLVDRLDHLRSLVCAGAAGALAEEVGHGDLVVGTVTVEHDYRLRFVEGDPPEHAASGALVRQMHGAVRERPFPFDVHFGRVASGDEDVVDEDRARQLREDTGALCVAWEGSGGARVADFNGLDFLEVRGVTDAADAEAAASFHEHVTRVMRSVARLLTGLNADQGER